MSATAAGATAAANANAATVKSRKGTATALPN